MSTDLAVIVVSYNVRDLLRECLRATFDSLSRCTGISASVIVVDNGSSGGSAAMVAAEFPQVRLFAEKVNHGFASGNNLALRALGFDSPDQAASRPELVMLLNPDAAPVGDALCRMADFMLGRPDAGGAGASLRYPDGRFQHGAFAFPGLAQLWFDLFPPRPARLLDSRLSGRYPRRAYQAGEPFRIDFALGAALMVRGDAIASAGLLDEGYRMYAEEVDWCWRMQRAGWPLWCVPAAQVIHHSGASTSQFRARAFEDLWRSRKLLYQRFYGPARRAMAARIVQLGMRRKLSELTRVMRRDEMTTEEARQRADSVRAVLEVFSQW